MTHHYYKKQHEAEILFCFAIRLIHNDAQISNSFNVISFNQKQAKQSCVNLFKEPNRHYEIVNALISKDKRVTRVKPYYIVS